MRTALPRLLRESLVFRRYWGAHTISLFGDQVSMLALPLVAVLTLDADAKQMGYLTAVGLAPNLLFALHAGAWVDRRGKRRQVMIAADVGRAGLLAAVPLLYVLDALTLEQLYVVAFLTGALTVLFGVADSSLFQTIVARDQFVEASSLLNGSRAFSYVAGPSVSGFLVQASSAPGALLADAVSYLASGALLGSIRPDEPRPDEEGGSLATGLRWIASSALVRASLLATATINFFNFVFFALFILYATKSLGVSAATLGLVLGAGAVGGLVGSVVAGPVTRRIGVGPTFVLGCVVFPAPILLVPLAEGPYEIVLACLFLAEFGSGLGVMLLDIAAGSIFAAVIPAAPVAGVRGPHVRQLRHSCARLAPRRPAGAWLGLRPALWIGAAGAMLGVLFLVWSPVPRLRELPDSRATRASHRSRGARTASRAGHRRRCRRGRDRRSTRRLRSPSARRRRLREARAEGQPRRNGLAWTRTSPRTRRRCDWGRIDGRISSTSSRRSSGAAETYSATGRAPPDMSTVAFVLRSTSAMIAASRAPMLQPTRPSRSASTRSFAARRSNARLAATTSATTESRCQRSASGLRPPGATCAARAS